jgi:hypothetical protein
MVGVIIPVSIGGFPHDYMIIRHQLSDNLSRVLEWMLKCKRIVEQIETMAILSDQVAAIMSVSGDPSATFSSSDVR